MLWTVVDRPTLAVIASEPSHGVLEVLVLGGPMALERNFDHTHIASFLGWETVERYDGVEFRIVSAPMHFDNIPTVPQGPSPELGQHTEELLMNAGMEWDAISALRDSGALG